MRQRVSLITLGVDDVAAARTFHERLGWRAGMDVEETVFFQIGGSILTLWSRDKLARNCGVTDGGGWGGVALAHNVGSPDDVDASDASASGMSRLERRRLRSSLAVFLVSPTSEWCLSSGAL